MRIVFMGTPDFAVSSLEALLDAGMNVVGVITAPDRPAGRGHKLQPSAVKQCAERHGLPLLQPPKLKNPEFLDALREWKADLQIVVAFRMLPEVVWDMPEHGTVNVHGSLLPNYRGAAPIHWAVINGETETGVTTFQLAHAIDTGAILGQSTLPIGPNDTTGDVHDRMKEAGAHLLVKTVQDIANKKTAATPQNDLIDKGLPTLEAPKIAKVDAQVDWSQPGAAIHNLIRGMHPFPGAWTVLDGNVVKLHAARLVGAVSKAAPGTLNVKEGILTVSSGDVLLEIQELQLQGKRRMTAEELLRGVELDGKCFEAKAQVQD